MTGVNVGNASDASINIDSSMTSESALLDWNDSEEIAPAIPYGTVGRFRRGESGGSGNSRSIIVGEVGTSPASALIPPEMTRSDRYAVLEERGSYLILSPSLSL